MLPDKRARVEPTESPRANSLETIVCVIASNSGDDATSDLAVASECAEYIPGAQFGPAPFDIDNDFPGACPSAEDNLGCGNFTGQEFESKGFHVGELPARGEASWLLRLRFRGALTQPVSLGLQSLGNFVPYAGGGAGDDADTDNDRALAGASPNGASMRVSTPVCLLADALLVFLLGMEGAFSRARPGRC